MKLVKERTAGGGGDVVVVVGVKLDEESKALLTWTLMKVSQPGDSIIALHVLHSLSGDGGGTSSLLSLVKAFDSLLAVYEGFCNLKQVHLKLKVCRGSSAKKVLVREAKIIGASKVIVGTSKAHHKIRSATSVAKYCSKKLSKNVSVFSVNGGKIVFKREASSSSISHRGKTNEENPNCLLKYSKNNPDPCARHVVLRECSGARTPNELPCKDENTCNSLALAPVRVSKDMPTSSSDLIVGRPVSTRGWPNIRRLLLHKKKSNVEKSSMSKQVCKIPSQGSLSVVYPDQKQSASFVDEHYSNLEDDSVIKQGASMVPLAPLSPEHGSYYLQEELQGLHEKYSSVCRLFSYEELRLATSSFSPENMVGKGGSSHVYRGVLPNGKALAVKILKPSDTVLKEFLVEIEIITTLHHKNIISLSGFCFEHNNLLLVYEFMSRGSLEENLHGKKKDGNTFRWQERYKVAVGVAEALDYLHNDSPQHVIHMDVKSSNILLSDDFQPKLSDFGLASWLPSSSLNMTCSDVTGTFGYLAPEYFMHGKVSDKVDVFAFGVVLLELLSGRMPINSQCVKGQESLVMWAKPILEGGEFSQLLDPNIVNKYNEDEVERMVLAATLSIRHSPQSRPEIRHVLKLLKGDEETTIWARQQVTDPSPGGDEEEAYHNNIQSHINLALLNLDDDSLSTSSSDQGVLSDKFPSGRCSRASSSD